MASINYKAEGIVTDIQRFSVHDGPGIRTIVFLKGCPLSCFWCCNPETQSKDPVILFQKDRCVRCGKCVSVCRQHAPSLALEGRIDRDKCIGCGECASVCPTGALVLKGDRMTVEQVVRILKKDSIIYRKSKGGITLSGGEALVQWKYAVELLKGCKAQGWHTLKLRKSRRWRDMSIEDRVRELNGGTYTKKSYSVEEVQSILGITRQTVYKLIKQGCFQAVMLETGYRIIKTSFDKWLDNE